MNEKGYETNERTKEDMTFWKNEEKRGPTKNEITKEAQGPARGGRSMGLPGGSSLADEGLIAGISLQPEGMHVVRNKSQTRRAMTPGTVPPAVPRRAGVMEVRRWQRVLATEQQPRRLLAPLFALCVRYSHSALGRSRIRTVFSEELPHV
jgi:hypothetical protein